MEGTRSIVLGLVLLGLVQPASAIEIYKRGVAGYKTSDQVHKMDLSANKMKSMSYIKSVQTQSLEFVKGLRAQLPELQSGTSELQEKNVHPFKGGLSFRFQQSFKSVPVQGAELLAVYYETGEVESVSSSLVAVPDSFNVVPSVSETAALEAAKVSAGIIVADKAPSETDGLQIVPSEDQKTFDLVWQMHIREAKNGFNPVKVQVYADGPRAGEVRMMVSASHSVTSTRVTVFDASVLGAEQLPHPRRPGKAVIRSDQRLERISRTDDIGKAYINIKITLELFEKVFNYRSFDNRRTEVRAAVRAVTNIQDNPDTPEDDSMDFRQNAAWLGPWKMFIFGIGGDRLRNLPGALGVVAHEFTHGVITSTSDLIYERESGALNEHFADVFGELIERGANRAAPGFLIGESAMGPGSRARALRDMVNPNRGLSPQPKDMSQYPRELGRGCATPSNENDNCGVHVLSGIPNRAAAYIISKLGERKAAEMFWPVMTARLSRNATFTDYKNQMSRQCRSAGGEACSVVASAFALVGL